VVPPAPDSDPGDADSASDQAPSESPAKADAEDSPQTRGDADKATASGRRPEEPQLDLEDTPDTKSRPGGRRRKKSSRGKRASVPSWDEIMFGGPTPHV
jgi:hypothetical protein